MGYEYKCKNREVKKTVKRHDRFRDGFENTTVKGRKLNKKRYERFDEDFEQ